MKRSIALKPPASVFWGGRGKTKPDLTEVKQVRLDNIGSRPNSRWEETGVAPSSKEHRMPEGRDNDGGLQKYQVILTVGIQHRTVTSREP